MKRNRFNPHGRPSPYDLGYRVGMRVNNLYRSKETGEVTKYPGTVKRLHKHCMVVTDDTGGEITCHPHGCFEPIESERAAKEEAS